MDNHPFTTYIKDSSLRILYNNTRSRSTPRDFFVGKTVHDFLPEEAAEQSTRADREVLARNRPVEITQSRVLLNGQKKWWKNVKFPINLPNGSRLIGGMTLNITEQKHAEEALKKSEHLYRKAIEGVSGVPYRLDFQSDKYDFMGEGIERLTGYAPGEFTHPLFQSIWEEFIPTGGLEGLTWAQARQMLQDNPGLTWQANFLIKTKKGEKRWVADAASLIVDDSGKAVGSIGLLQDITRSKRQEEQIRNALGEKEVLLQEIHHRVRNNMQIIASLSNMQAKRSRNEQVISALQENHNRVAAMATVHELLYQSQSLAHIDLQRYVTKLAERLLIVYGCAGQIDLKVVASETIEIDIHRAAPFGLILNELITNALEHAFPDGRSGSMEIRAHTTDGEVEITIADDGCGLPKGTAPVQY